MDLLLAEASQISTRKNIGGLLRLANESLEDKCLQLFEGCILTQMYTQSSETVDAIDGPAVPVASQSGQELHQGLAECPALAEACTDVYPSAYGDERRRGEEVHAGQRPYSRGGRDYYPERSVCDRLRSYANSEEGMQPRLGDEESFAESFSTTWEACRFENPRRLELADALPAMGAAVGAGAAAELGAKIPGETLRILAESIVHKSAMLASPSGADDLLPSWSEHPHCQTGEGIHCEALMNIAVGLAMRGRFEESESFWRRAFPETGPQPPGCASDGAADHPASTEPSSSAHSEAPVSDNEYGLAPFQSSAVATAAILDGIEALVSRNECAEAQDFVLASTKSDPSQWYSPIDASKHDCLGLVEHARGRFTDSSAPASILTALSLTAVRMGIIARCRLMEASAHPMDTAPIINDVMGFSSGPDKACHMVALAELLNDEMDESAAQEIVDKASYEVMQLPPSDTRFELQRVVARILAEQGRVEVALQVVYDQASSGGIIAKQKVGVMKTLADIDCVVREKGANLSIGSLRLLKLIANRW
jgi:hypothetical protein